MKFSNLRGFTLVELIVVITIIWILATVWFVSYSNYLTGARDSNRISQMVKISDSLQVYSTTKNLPLPDDYINITASGAVNVIGYQGYLWVDVLETIDYTNGGIDPKDKWYFTYYVSQDRQSMQLLALMEEDGGIAYTPKYWQVHAEVYPNRFPKVYGRKLWILTQIDTNTPAQEITGITTVDIVTTTNQYVAHISDDVKLEWAGTVLRASIPNANCNRLKQTSGVNTDGLYTINPRGSWEVQVYCNMETAWGGWTLVARWVIGGNWVLNLANNVGTVTNLNAPYTLSITNLSYTESMLASYLSSRTISTSKQIATTSATLVVSWSTLTSTLITGWTPGDGYNGKPGMLFVK